MTEKSISTVKRVCAAGVAVATVFASSVAVSAAELPHVRSQRITENFTDAIQAAHERIAMEKSGETAMMREASKSIDESIAVPHSSHRRQKIRGICIYLTRHYIRCRI